MKGMCSESCELRKELLEAKDKYHFMDKSCLPAKLEDNYAWYSKETLMCCICCLDAVKCAVDRKETIVTVEQDIDIIEKLNRSIYYYLMYDSLHVTHQTRLQRWLMWWKRRC